MDKKIKNGLKVGWPFVVLRVWGHGVNLLMKGDLLFHPRFPVDPGPDFFDPELGIASVQPSFQVGQVEQVDLHFRIYRRMPPEAEDVRVWRYDQLTVDYP